MTEDNPDECQRPNAEAMAKLGAVLRELYPIDPRRVYTRRYSMVLCGRWDHLLTGEGDPPTECPICKAFLDAS